MSTSPKLKGSFFYLIFFFFLLLFFYWLIWKFAEFSGFAIASVVITTVLFAYLVFLNKGKANKEYEPIVNFFITLFVSLVGIYIGISISNNQNSTASKQKVIEILRASKKDFSSVETEIKFIAGFMADRFRETDTSFKTVNGNQFSSIPTLLDRSLAQDFFILSVDSSLMPRIIQLNRICIFGYQNLNSPTIKTISEFNLSADITATYKNALFRYIDLQIQILEGSIKKNTIPARIDSIKSENKSEIDGLKQKYSRYTFHLPSGDVDVLQPRQNSIQPIEYNGRIITLVEL